MHPSSHNSDVVKVAVVTQSLASAPPVAYLQKTIAVTLIGLALLGYWLV